MTPILRYQDRQGRGPFRPGMTAQWADTTGDSPPTVFEEFPQLLDILPRLHDRKLHVGCACEGRDGIDRYFTASEQARLARLGYRLHRVPTSTVIMRSDSQVVFAWHRPLKTLARVR